MIVKLEEEDEREQKPRWKLRHGLPRRTGQLSWNAAVGHQPLAGESSLDRPSPLLIWSPPSWKLSLPENSLRGFSALPTVRACPSEKTWKCGCCGSMARCVLLLGFCLFFCFAYFFRALIFTGWFLSFSGGQRRRWRRCSLDAPPRWVLVTFSFCMWAGGQGRGFNSRGGRGPYIHTYIHLSTFHSSAQSIQTLSTTTKYQCFERNDFIISWHQLDPLMSGSTTPKTTRTIYRRKKVW